MSKNKYLPIIELRPAEMLALTELPNKDKDAVVPLFRLRPWGVSHDLDKSVERLKKAFGSRPAYLEVAEPEYVEKRRTVHDELDALRSPTGGYRNWFDYLQEPKNQHFIPSLQKGGPLADFYTQIESLFSLNRGLLIRLESSPESAVKAAAQAISARTENGGGVVFVLDYGKQDARFDQLDELIRRSIEVIQRECRNADVALSASSFPGSFTSISQQKIYERLLFNQLARNDFPDLIYSDRGSARAEKQLGGGGLPAPRIDYAKKDAWHFYRQGAALTTAFDGYKAQALAVMNDPDVWEKRLKLWACQMIERTAAGDSDGGISSPNRSTAVRINMHLHRQIFYDDETSFLDTDEEWID